MATETKPVSLSSTVYHSLTGLIEGHQYDPHRLLGLHDNGQTIRVWRPGASEVFLEVKGQDVKATRVHEAGLFEYRLPSGITYVDYRVYHSSGLKAHDPYAFLPTFGEVDQYLFNHGTHYELYRVLGARLYKHQNISGVKFAVWAPNAKSVSLVGDFNNWDGRVNPMRTLGECGVWELFVPGLTAGVRYKFEIRTQAGDRLLKSDPMALSSELRPSTASVIADVEAFKWEDTDWVKQRSATKDRPKPMNIYEVHLGSWKKKDGGFVNYREVAHQLADYAKDMGYTHIELMPIAEHPLDESWGYQVTGFYAVTSRFGTPEDFQYFVNHLHKNQIGVILDWVPGHFPRDEFSLARFDGSSLYEHADPRQGLHPHWETGIFNFGRKEVTNFLLANALFWIDVMHIDALRVDAVASMLYLDYGREAGEWIPNQYGGKENLEAIEFLKHTNSIIHERFPGAVTIAEESTAFTGVSHPVSSGGLGFDLKWNMGWMNDTLRYFHKDPIYRHHHHNDLTFGLLYAFTEKFVLVLSHDEVVHGKGSLLSKMPGDYWQKFANLRLLLSYMTCQPGKKLLFMGGEVGQWNEWQCKGEVEWMLLTFPVHDGLHSMVRDLNHFYLEHPALWEKDFDHTGFEWVGLHDRDNSVVAYLRKGEKSLVLCVHNFTPQYIPEYIVHLKNVRKASEVFNTDAAKYGGSGKENTTIGIAKTDGKPTGIKVQVAPLATMIFEVEFC
ncbi:MAG: 1,4-alpha-glucan branching protein GlgB [Chlamydiales bacterium]|nr:1,4-alpha-glucan branching protein GlgB [Chlamydiales bacterium]